MSENNDRKHLSLSKLMRVIAEHLPEIFDKQARQKFGMFLIALGAELADLEVHEWQSPAGSDGHWLDDQIVRELFAPKSKRL